MNGTARPGCSRSGREATRRSPWGIHEFPLGVFIHGPHSIPLVLAGAQRLVHHS